VPRDRTRELDCSETTDETACNECVLKQGHIDTPSGGRYVSASNLVNYEYQFKSLPVLRATASAP